MKECELPKEKIQNLKVVHKTSKQIFTYTTYRIHVIILLRMRKTPDEVSEIILLDEDTVRACFDKYTAIDLLWALKKAYFEANAIYVLLDNAKYHFSGIVQGSVKNSKIKLVPLPAYSPEFNLIKKLMQILYL